MKESEPQTPLEIEMMDAVEKYCVKDENWEANKLMVLRNLRKLTKL